MKIARLETIGTRVYQWVLGWADRPSGPLVLALLAVAEATAFPAPTEAFLVALALGRPRRAWWLGALAAGASVTGALIGYWTGAGFFESVGRPLLASWGLTERLDSIVSVYRANTFALLATSGYTPVPWMLYTIAGGAFDIPIGTFVAGALAGRTLKYLPLVGLTYFFGPRVRRILDRYAPWAAAGFVALLLLWLVLQAARS